jgi:uncharacterized DUF497 family protein
MLHFKWDKIKARANIGKHGVSFEEAKTVFFDPNGRLISDPDHSDDEARFLLLGMSERIRLIVVCHCYRDRDVIRIISVRKATKRERQVYEEYLP